MGITEMLKQTIKRSDLLGAPAILRTNGQTFYESLFGGIITIMLFIFFVYIFIIKLMDILNLQEIQASMKYQNVQNDTSSIDDFFLGIDMPFISQQEMMTLFKIQLKVIETGKTDKIISLVKCTQQMWSSRGIYQSFLYTGKYMCPQFTDQLTIYKTTTQQSYLRISVDCQNCSDPAFLQVQKRVSASHDLFQANIQMINSIRSDGQQNPIRKYIDPAPFTTFSPGLGSRTLIQLMTYEIVTDTSFMPYSQYQTLSGFVIANKLSNKIQIDPDSDSDLLICKIQKYKLQVEVQRQYGKFDDLLSYVGGLFGLIFIFISFFLAPYNQLKYQIMVAQNVFKNQSLENVNQITQNNWNFFTYLKFVVYDWLSFLDCPPKKWKQMKSFNQSITEALCLLDIKYLIKRIRYLEHAVTVVLQKNKQICLKIVDIPNIQTVRKQRKVIEMFDNYRKNKLKQKKQSKSLADILIKKTIQKTFFQFAEPDQKFQEMKNHQQKWKQQVSDSQQIQDENVKWEIQLAIKEMLKLKQDDNQYNTIFYLMENDFKGWAELNTNSRVQNKINSKKSEISSFHESQNFVGQLAHSMPSLQRFNKQDLSFSDRQLFHGSNQTFQKQKQKALQNLANLMKGKQVDDNGKYKKDNGNKK